MAMTTAPGLEPKAESHLDSKIKRSPGKVATGVFGVVLAAGLIYAGSQLVSDVSHVHTGSMLPFILLGIALLIALGFEFVNGFHDTANAVATVIYTHTLEPHLAVLWSGVWNFLGVLVSIGRGRLRDHLAAAGRAHPPGRRQRRVRDGLRAAHRGHHLEPRHVVVRSPVVELAHPHRLDHRRRSRQSAHVRQDGHERRRLVAGGQHRQVAAHLADRRLRERGRAAAPDEGRHPEQEALRGPRGHRASAVLDPLPPHAHVHGRELRSRLQRRSEGHGPHHAHPRRHRSHGVRPQPRRDAGRRAGLHRRVRAGERHARPLRAGRCAAGPGRSRGRHRVRALAHGRAGHDPRAVAHGPRHRERPGSLQGAHATSPRTRRATSATTCTSWARRCG